MSVGHIARVFEEGGIATVIVAAKAFRSMLEPMKTPRLLLTPHPMGRPLGAPGDSERQRDVITAALRMLHNAEPGAIEEVPGSYFCMGDR